MTTQAYQAASASAIPAHLFSTQTAVKAPSLGNPVAYYARFARIAGGAREALFLSQLWYWTQRMIAKHGESFDGWIWKDADEWQTETGLTRAEQKTARKHLGERGLLTTSKKGRVHGTLQFRLNTHVLLCLLADIEQIAKAQAQKVKRSSPIRSRYIGENAKDITENTVETSQKLQQTASRENVVVSKSSIVEADTTPQAQFSDAHEIAFKLEGQGFDSKVAAWLVSAHGEKECAYQLERLAREKNVKSPVRWLRTAITKGHRDARGIPESAQESSVSAPTPVELAQIEQKRLARERENAGIAQRVFERLSPSRQSYVGRCVELEHKSLAQVVEREENYAFAIESRRGRTQ